MQTQRSKILKCLRISILATICVWLLVAVIRGDKPEDFRRTFLKLRTTDELFKKYRRTIDARDIYRRTFDARDKARDASREADAVLDVLSFRQEEGLDDKLIAYFEAVRDNEAAKGRLNMVPGQKGPEPETGALMQCIGKRGTARARAFVLSEIKSPYPYVRASVIESLGPINWHDDTNKELLLQVRPLLTDTDCDVIDWSLRLLRG